METQSGFCEEYTEFLNVVREIHAWNVQTDIIWDTENLWNCTSKSFETQYACNPPPRRLQKLSESYKSEASDRRKFLLKQNILTMPDASSAEKIADLSLHISKQATCKIKWYISNKYLVYLFHFHLVCPRSPKCWRGWFKVSTNATR